MYFHGVKSTAHPPIKGALGHSTDFILKQPNTAVINICLLWYNHAVYCWNNQAHRHWKIKSFSSIHLFFALSEASPYQNECFFWKSSKVRGGGSKTVWNFSEKWKSCARISPELAHAIKSKKKSVLVGRGFPYQWLCARTNYCVF